MEWDHGWIKIIWDWITDGLRSYGIGSWSDSGIGFRLNEMEWRMDRGQMRLKTNKEAMVWPGCWVHCDFVRTCRRRRVGSTDYTAGQLYCWNNHRCRLQSTETENTLLFHLKRTLIYFFIYWINSYSASDHHKKLIRGALCTSRKDVRVMSLRTTAP